MRTSFDFTIQMPTTKDVTKSPAPKRAPMLYEIPPSEPDATREVITSPAPLANARSVTADKDSENLRKSEIFWIP